MRSSRKEGVRWYKLVRYHKEGRDELSRRVSSTITRLQDQYIKDYASARAQLARLRRAVSKSPGSQPDVWELMANCIPQELVDERDDAASPGEWAAHLVLTLYATHQQSSKKPMHQRTDRGEGEYHGLGNAVAELVRINKANQKGEDLEYGEMPHRFAALVTADTIGEVAHYARQLIQQLRAVEVPLDYGRFAGQLYDYQFPFAKDRVRLCWAREFAVDRNNTGQNE